MAVNDFDTLIAAGQPLTREQAESLLTAADLIAIGVFGEKARQARTGEIVTFGRVAEVGRDAVLPDAAAPGEVRLLGPCGSIDEGVELVRAAAAAAKGVPVTGFSLDQLAGLAGGDPGALTAAAQRLATAGLTAIAEVPVDGFAGSAAIVAAVDAVRRGGLGAWRVTVHRAAMSDRLDLIERVAHLQQASGGVRAFAPLPRFDPPDAPSTGYDDVRSIALARLMTDVPVIQVDWPIYGPKLAQVAITFGAGDIDGISAADDPALGPRRAAVAEIERQIRAAAAVPRERDARFAPRPAP